uniref:Translocation protein SEC62 n=1 Tax=Caligus rogercresseyi TaxID=217165 RepID=C1BPF6_CALRO|nr:Translocation protein SEC62 [Caligus rogercresseyi]|eukprot:TRINITY_DN2407_c0_g1_i1.p1 TRINITY_DN2407_c0_g1~~TRINITY_DN2407_c0_g1_i1.p1  ORF type:complete len:333 (-),score=133.08 TRINITY_DN2407_c0_g1_i1:752-1750(-)
MNRRKKDGDGGKKSDSMNVRGPMSKEEKSVVSWLRKTVPVKKTKFLNTHVVEYFIGSKAVDALVTDSPWAPEKAPKDSSGLVFHVREDAIAYMDELLKHKMFHRAKKIPVPEKTKKIKSGKESSGNKSEASPMPGSDAAKKKRKIRLDMHLDQIFLDSQDAYVWLYDPIPWYYWAGGTLIVLGIIGICLFPLWPPILRRGVHYISILGVGFLVFIFGLATFQSVLFGILFLLSGGKLRFWLLPNLTADVGFFQSFMPLYDYTYTGESKKKKKNKAKDSDDEESNDEDEEEESGNKSGEEEEDSDDSTSKKSSTGKDFEIVNKNDTDLEPDDN